MPTVLNAANEKAVALFMDGKIKFLDIYDIIKRCMNEHKNRMHPALEDIFEVEQKVYEYIDRFIQE